MAGSDVEGTDVLRGANRLKAPHRRPSGGRRGATSGDQEHVGQGLEVATTPVPLAQWVIGASNDVRRAADVLAVTSWRPG